MVERRSYPDLHRCLSWYKIVQNSHTDLAESLPWTLQGRCSLALAEGRLLLLTENRDWLQRSRFSLTRAMESCVASGNISISLHQGLSGLGWAALLVNRLLEPHERFDVSDVDDAVVDYFSGHEHENLDLIGGSSGLVVYALAHPDPLFRCRIFDAYAASIRSRLAEWKSPTRPTTGLIPVENGGAHRGPGACLWNSGLAHGMPGILGVLARIMSSGYKPAAMIDLLRQTTACCIADIRSDDVHEYVGYFRDDPTPSRSAWCYGEPGFAAALCASAAASGDDLLKQRATELFCSSILQKDPDKRFLAEIGICHGWSGILLTSRYISGFSSRPDNRLSRIYALACAEIAQVLDGALANGSIPTVFAEGLPQAEQDLSFLCGALGVLHVLIDGLDGCRRRDPDLPWADCLLL
jgi:hypothetical protein